MMSKEEVAEIMTYCKEKGISYKSRLEELGIPACFMTAVCVSFIIVDKTCLGLSAALIPWIAGAVAVICAAAFCVIMKKYIGKEPVLKL